MLDLAKFKQHLVGSGAVEKEQLERAQKHAFDHGLSLSEALLALNIVGSRKLGKCLSEIYGLPYVSLQNRPLSPEAQTMLSAPCVVQWKAFPVHCERKENIFTLAVHDPDQMVKIEKAFRFLLQPVALGFVIVSRPELDEALEKHYGTAVERMRAADGKPPVVAPSAGKKKLKLSGLHRDAPSSAAVPSDAASLSKTADASKPDAKASASSAAAAPRPLSRYHPAAAPARSAAEPRPLSSAGAAPQTDTAADKPAATRDVDVTDMSRSLLNSVALLAQTRLGGDSVKILQAKTRVRYCRLLAVRSNLAPDSCDAIAMAAWLSVLDAPGEVVKQLVTPYNLDAILQADGDAHAALLPESKILGLVRRYQDFKASDPDAARDINRVRDHLRAHEAPDPEQDAFMETFLQILMDEEFLSEMGKASGRILIVDPVEAAGASLAPPLADDGYEVDVVPDSASAEERVRTEQPDAVLVSMDLPRQSGLRFCQKMKRDEATSAMPLIALIPKPDDQLATECFRAGVEDCFPKPVDLERLFIRLHRMIKPPAVPVAEAGVKGSLADMSFTDMIQILCAGGKSMEILLVREGVKGCVHVSEGNVVHAEAGDKKGEAAFYDIMQWKDGDFTTRPRTEFPERTVQGSLMGLLMEGARLSDES